MCVVTIFQTKDVFRQPTNEELNNYLKEKDISPIVIKNIDKWTLVLSENSFLSLSVYKDSGQISSSRSSIANNSSIEPVTIGLTSWGNKKEHVNIATIIINNKDLLEKAIKVKVKLLSTTGTFEETEVMNNKNGAIIFFDNNQILDGRLDEVNIYDKENKEIFNKKL
jgi:hypothetical protein